MLIEIVDGPIAAEAIVAAMKAGSDGAVCVFDGIVRDNTRGRKTLYLDYEAYREMALEQMQRLSAEAVERFGVRDVVRHPLVASIVDAYEQRAQARRDVTAEQNGPGQ